MKTTRKILALALAVFMMLALAVPVFADTHTHDSDCAPAHNHQLSELVAALYPGETIPTTPLEAASLAETINQAYNLSDANAVTETQIIYLGQYGQNRFVPVDGYYAGLCTDDCCALEGGCGLKAGDPAAPTNPGVITINDSVEGKLYDLYRIFDLTGSNPDETTGEYANVAYTIDPTWAGFFATGAAGAAYILAAQPADGSLSPISIDGATKYINITDDNVADFAQDALAYAAANNIAPVKTATGDGDDLVVDDLELGYYMVYPRGAADIKDTYASICSLTSTVPAAEIVIKAEYPTIDKNITEEGKDPAKVNEAAIGDIIPYTLTTKIPDMTGYTKYFFVAHDTLSDGLTLNNTVENNKNTGFTVKIGDTTLVEGTDYDVDIDGQSFRIIFKNMVSRTADTGKTVTIEYSATLNDNALINEANSNSATIEYSNDPSVKPEYDEEPENPDDPDDENYTFKKGEEEVEPTEESVESETETYTTSLTLLKVDESGEILSGAEFTLTGDTNKVRVTTDVSFVVDNTNGTYYKLANGKYTLDAPVAEHVEEAEDGAYVVMTEGYVLAEGQESFTIGETTYRALEESETVEEGTLRYKHFKSNENLYDEDNLENKFKKTTTTTVLTDTSDADIKGYVDETTGLLTFEGLGAGTYTLTESVTPEGYNTINPITFTVSFDAESKTFTGSSPITLELTEIVNKSGTVLPSTGGIGTTLFITLGMIAMLGAGVFLVTNKRMSKESF